MIFKMLLCVFWASATAASSSLDSPGQSMAAVTSSQPIFARSGIFARTTGLRKRVEICFPDTTSWYDMVKRYAVYSQQGLTGSLTAALDESEMTLTGNLTLASSQNDPNRVFCDIFPKASGESGTSFPRCLLETAINDFCTVSQDTWINSTSPSSTDSKGGRWKTYQFTGYSISGLYVGVEFSKAPECLGHRRSLYPYNNTPDRHCKDKLLAGIVDRCQTNSKYIKFGGATTDSCETWAIYPLPPFKNALKGETFVLSATSGPTAYSLCGPTSLAGVFPTAESWSTPTAASQATVIPPSNKTEFASADKTGTTGTTGTTSGDQKITQRITFVAVTTMTGTTGTTSSGEKIKRTDTVTSVIAGETSKAASAVPAGPGRRQLVGS